MAHIWFIFIGGIDSSSSTVVYLPIPGPVLDPSISISIGFSLCMMFFGDGSLVIIKSA